MDEKILMLCGGPSLGGKIEIRLENPTLNNFKAYGGKNEKTERFWNEKLQLYLHFV